MGPAHEGSPLSRRPGPPLCPASSHPPPHLLPVSGAGTGSVPWLSLKCVADTMEGGAEPLPTCVRSRFLTRSGGGCSVLWSRERGLKGTPLPRRRPHSHQAGGRSAPPVGAKEAQPPSWSPAIPAHLPLGTPGSPLCHPLGEGGNRSPSELQGQPCPLGLPRGPLSEAGSPQPTSQHLSPRHLSPSGSVPGSGCRTGGSDPVRCLRRKQLHPRPIPRGLTDAS